MTLQYYSESDSLFMTLREVASAQTRGIAEGVNIDFDDAGNIIGFDIDHASTKLDLMTLEATALPITSLPAT